MLMWLLRRKVNHKSHKRKQKNLFLKLQNRKLIIKNIFMNLTKSYLKDLTCQINGAAIEVHKFLGPGLLENIYHKCLL